MTFQGQSTIISMRFMYILVVGLAFLVMLSAGCQGLSKEAKVKCPKCGAVFAIQEGIDEMDNN